MSPLQHPFNAQHLPSAALQARPGSTRASAERRHGFAAFDCQVNAISTDELFRRYERCGFLYPAKLQTLAPYLPLVKENWRKVRRAGELLQWVATYEDDANGQWGSIASWRSTASGWVTQHLVAQGGPLASRAVMLAGQAVRLEERRDSAHQSWFRRKNRYANKIFGSITSALGQRNSWVGDYSYYFLSLALLPQPSSTLRVDAATVADLPELRHAVTAARSAVYCAAEALVDDDIALEAVDQLYAHVGLRRYRRILIARSTTSSGILGVAVAYRGPLGLNFSFLENRCDLILAPALSAARAREVCAALTAAVGPTYEHFEPGAVPIVIDTGYAEALRALGAEYLRDYAQSIWLSAGFEAWYRHTERFYERLLNAGRHRGLGQRTAHAATLSP
jgi:hypothetical protein